MGREPKKKNPGDVGVSPGQRMVKEVEEKWSQRQVQIQITFQHFGLKVAESLHYVVFIYFSFEEPERLHNPRTEKWWYYSIAFHV